MCWYSQAQTLQAQWAQMSFQVAHAMELGALDATCCAGLIVYPVYTPRKVWRRFSGDCTAFLPVLQLSIGSLACMSEVTTRNGWIT